MHMAFETVEDESKIGVRFEPLENDRRAYLESVAESAANANRTIASLHAHQAPDGDRNTAKTPTFLQALAYDCIDAGADVFVVTGPHVLRGMEIYKDRPIFYSLGNLFYQTETIDQLPKESFDYYGIDDPTDTTELFRSRYFDSSGSPAGSLARDEYWETIVPVCRFENGGLHSIQLYPCVLGQNRELPQRGTPRVATGETATAILDHFEKLSKSHDIEFTSDGEVGSVVS
ncbi:capsule synthesis protein CapA [Natronococcus amylolyticus DSM 10524]|uniref:Capsule synthesis protein CapA n=2 Tax=Natronococcus amylolyticus TaxID=44470 RepID=L9X629_9EURY|nr:capsule synthesis protein CapA [Natronococcus amylolyticus DSM 10524]